MKQVRGSTTKGTVITYKYSVHAVPKNFPSKTWPYGKGVRVLCDPGVVLVETVFTDQPVNCAFCIETMEDIQAYNSATITS